MAFSLAVNEEKYSLTDLNFFDVAFMIFELMSQVKS